jgi:hypothetical protein
MTVKNNEFRLTRAEILKLAKIAEQFEKVNLYTIKQNSSSGIGISTTVKMSLLDKDDTSIDITDVESW